MREGFIGKYRIYTIRVAEFAEGDCRWCVNTGAEIPAVSEYHAGCKTLKEALCMALDQAEENDDTLDDIKEQSYVYLKDKKTDKIILFYVSFFSVVRRELFGHCVGSAMEAWASLDDYDVLYRHVRPYEGSELLDFIGSNFARRNIQHPEHDAYKAVAYIPDPPRLVLATPLHVGNVYEPSELAERFYRVDGSKNLVDFLKIED